MLSREIVKMMVAGMILGQVLGMFGASTWVIIVCSVGMGMTWRMPH